ncbi:MAG: hypothetical protein ABI882_15885, partial [Acidobacteriota bacterium]
TAVEASHTDERTAYASVEDRMRALGAGFQMHVPKPVEPAELLAVVASLAGRMGKWKLQPEAETEVGEKR